MMGTANTLDIAKPGYKHFNSATNTKYRLFQITLPHTLRCRNSISKTPTGFRRKHIVPSSTKRSVAPAIPLNVRSLRRLFKRFVVGDPERRLDVPLARFTKEQRNRRDATGKVNKYMYSKRRTVAVATFLALQHALDNSMTFRHAIGLQPDIILSTMTMSKWEAVAKEVLKRGRRNLSDKEVIDLGTNMYKETALLLLPEGND